MSRRTLAAFTAGILTLLGGSRLLHAEEPTAARPVERRADLPPWSVRLTAGGGIALPTTHEDLLGEEGYSGARWAYSLAVERNLHGPFGVGLLGLYGNRSLEAAPTDERANYFGAVPPRYSEDWWIAAVELPLTFLVGHFGARTRQQWVELDVVPWAGVGRGNVELYADDAWRGGPAFGGQLRLLMRGPHVAGGFAAGAYSLRVPQRSSVAGPVDFGMVLFSAIGGFDG